MNWIKPDINNMPGPDVLLWIWDKVLGRGYDAYWRGDCYYGAGSSVCAWGDGDPHTSGFDEVPCYCIITPPSEEDLK